MTSVVQTTPTLAYLSTHDHMEMCANCKNSIGIQKISISKLDHVPYILISMSTVSKLLTRLFS